MLLGPHVLHKQLGGLEGLPADRAGGSGQAAKLLRKNAPGFKTSVCIYVDLGFNSTMTNRVLSIQWSIGNKRKIP